MEIVYLLGIGLSLLAALLWAVHNVAIRIGTEEGGVADALIIVLLVNPVLVAPTAAIVHYPNYGLTVESTLAFVAAGITGLMLGRICLFGGIKAIGASRTTPVVSASTLVSAALAVWLLGESVTLVRGVGIVLIVAGVAIISWLTAADASRESSWRDVGLSFMLPLGAALFIGIEPILVRVGLDAGTPVLVGLTVMMGAALVSYVAYRRLRGQVVHLPRRGRNRQWYLGAGVASTIGLVTYFAALEAAPVVVVIPIIQASPLMVIAISAVFLPERLERVTWPLVAAAAVVIVGATLVSLAG